MSILNSIRLRQSQAERPLHHTPAKHQPEMLYIGCIDARLDPIDDIGIEKGAALIFRNIGALVVKNEAKGQALDAHAVIESGEIPHNVNIAAVLEFFLTHIPQLPGHIKHIVVSGHTDCGGLKACHYGVNEHDHYLPLYLQSLQTVRAKVRENARINGWNDAQLLHALEEESVRQSIANLLTYPIVEQAIAKNTLEVHGWVINTATQRILEMNLKTLEFEPMTVQPE
jgi:carbonic anhydrase